MPSGVWIGMSSESLSQVRRDAVSIGSAPAENVSQFVEILATDVPPGAYWYRFKDNELGAVLKTTRVSGLSRSETIHLAGDITKEYKAEFALIETQQIVRSFNAQSTLLSAQLWRENSGIWQSYFMVSNHEITQVLFDPKKFGFDDFFLPAERLPDVQANEKAVREMMKEVQSTASQSNLLPLIDLLPEVVEVVKESASPPTATAPTQTAPDSTQELESTPASPTATPVQQPKSTALATQSPTEAETMSAPSGFPIVPVAILAALIVGIILYLLRRKKP